VHVHSIVEDPAKPLHPLLISRTLSQIAYADIKEIKKIGKGKILAEMATAKANDLTNNCRLEKEDLKAFIPTYRTVRTGIGTFRSILIKQIFSSFLRLSARLLRSDA